MENLYLNHPYGKYQLGSLEQVHSLKREQLKQLHQLFVHPENMSLSIAGGISADEVKSFIADLEKGLNKLSNNKPLQFKKDVLVEPKLTAPRWAAADYQREQTHIIVGGLGLSMFDHDRFAFRVLQNILGGQSGRLFIELREKKSMAYSVSPMCMEGLEPGYVGTYIACAPQKKDEAIAGIKVVLETLAEKGPSQAEMTRAKNYYLGQRAMDMQSTWSLASGFGLELLYRGEVLSEGKIRKEIEAITAKKVQNIGEQYLVKSPMITVTVG